MKRILLALALLLLSLPCRAQVAFDAVTAPETQCTTCSTLANSNITVGSGTNRALVAAVCWGITNTNTVTGFTWNAQNLVAIPGATGDIGLGHCELWAVLNPGSGAGTLTVTISATNSQIVLGAVSFSGVNQTGGTSSFLGTTTSGTSNTATITVSSAVGRFTMDVVPQTNLSTNTGTQTTNWINNCCQVGNTSGRQTGAASTVFTWTLGASTAWTDSAVDILPAAGAAGGGSLQTVGVGQ